MNETENQIRLRRAKETLESCQAKEDETRKALAVAVEDRKRAFGRYAELFLEEERQEVALRLKDNN